MEKRNKNGRSWFSNYLNSSIGKKQTMAVAGLLWIGFVVNHLIGNFPMVFSSDVFNLVANFYATNKVIMYSGEVILSFLLFLHGFQAIRLKLENNKARPQAYAVVKKKGKAGSASFTMIYTGITLLFFLVFHIYTFKYGTYIETTVDGVVMRDMYATVAESFSQAWYSAIYIVCMIAVGLHLSHGLQSAFQTFGLNHTKYWGLISLSSKGLALVVSLGNIGITVVMFLKGA